MCRGFFIWFALHIEYAQETDGYIRLAFVKKKLFDNYEALDDDDMDDAAKTETEDKSVKTPEMSLKYRQMSQNTSQMNRQRMKAHHRLLTSKGQ